MNKWEIIKGPIITEKSNDLLENENKYTFKVALDANKVEIKQAIEEIYNVKVVDIATIKALAELPTKEVLLATVLSAFQAPIAAFARAVQAIVDKGDEAAE